MFEDLVTPAALVDIDVFEANIQRGVHRAAELGVDLRPHAKTVKSPELLERVVAAGATGFTVSTLGELRTLAAVSADLMYAVPVAAGKGLALREALGDAEVRLTVILDSTAGILGVPSDPRIDVAIEIDCDGHRGGVRPDDPMVYELADRLGDRLRGVMTHGGGSYLVSASEVATLAAAERDAVVGVAAGLRERGHRPGMVSVGSTPTFFSVDHLRGVTEARPGVYLFGDLSMVALGVMRESDLALSTLATVVGVVDRGRRALIDAGWSALSQDRGVPALDAMTGLGRVSTVGLDLSDSELIVSEANQEHGFVTMRNGGHTGLGVGERVRVWPNHACATAEMHSRLALVRGEDVIGRADRPRGWGPA